MKKKLGRIALTGAALLAASGLASGATFSAAHPRGGALAGTLYVGHPFPSANGHYDGDTFDLKVARNGRTAAFVGMFVYTDPGCPDAPFGNEYLTPADAPKVGVEASGAFSGSRTGKGTTKITDKISGRFDGMKAKATFEETESCKGDKPFKLTFAMHAK